MKLPLLGLVLALSAGAAAAQGGTAVASLLAKDGCQGCHAQADKVNGPSWHDIAARYVSRPDAPSYLAGKIRNGSSNTWGAAAMPPNAGIDELELKTIVEWIVAGAPASAH